MTVREIVLGAGPRAPGRDPGAIVEIPVRFPGEDLAEIAGMLAISGDEIVERFLAPVYLVSFVGFLPGFAYLRGLDPLLGRIPRRPRPRPRVPRGSVAIAAGCAGVYPADCPGGWNLLGRSVGFEPFDGDGVARLAAGSRVRFARIT